MNLKKVYMNRFHKLLCKHCVSNGDSDKDKRQLGEITFKFRPSIAILPRLWTRIKLRLKGYKGDIVQYASPKTYKIGDRIGQIIILPYPVVKFTESDFLYPSDRGECGYGSTGE